MKFSFNLESVLAYRKVVEEDEQRKLQSIESTMQRVRQVQLNLLADAANYSQMLAAAQTGGPIDVDLLKNAASYLDKLQSDVLKTTHLLSKLEEDKHTQLGKLIQAKRAREIVENLKEKKLTVHQKESNAMEQKLLDEISAERFCQNIEQSLPAEEADP
jgi:flagellar export protein FliJ